MQYKSALEKGFLHWKSDLVCEYNPFEAGLQRFVDMDKGEFIGKAALASRIERGPRRRLVSLVVDCDHAPAHAGDPVFGGGEQVGSVTLGWVRTPGRGEHRLRLRRP